MWTPEWGMSELTATCPELAPPGWYLYVANAVPK